MTKQVLPKVFAWMCFGLLVTFLTGYVLSLNPTAVINMASSFGGWGLLILAIIEIGLVIFLSARITKMSPLTAKLSFLLYAFVSGLTFSSIFLVYEITSVLYVFLITSIVFALFAIIGATTKMDLTKIGSYLFMALIAIVICMIINIFMQNSTFDLIISIVAIIIFVGFTAYDVQKLIKLGTLNVMDEDNLAIYGALDLYLDYINLFIHLLSIFGNNRDWLIKKNIL